MSMVSRLCIIDGQMSCNCPACRHEIDVYESDLYGTLMDGKNNDTKEYSVDCPECGQQFYTSVIYY